MTDYVFLSTVSVAAILVGVALLALLALLAIGAWGRAQRHYTAALFGCLILIWAVAIVVIVLIKRAI